MDYTDLKRRLERESRAHFEGNATDCRTVSAMLAESAAAIAALEAEVARKDAAIKRALDEAVADDMDGWDADLNAAITPR